MFPDIFPPHILKPRLSCSFPKDMHCTPFRLFFMHQAPSIFPSPYIPSLFHFRPYYKPLVRSWSCIMLSSWPGNATLITLLTNPFVFSSHSLTLGTPSMTSSLLESGPFAFRSFWSCWGPPLSAVFWVWSWLRAIGRKRRRRQRWWGRKRLETQSIRLIWMRKGVGLWRKGAEGASVSWGSSRAAESGA